MGEERRHYDDDDDEDDNSEEERKLLSRYGIWLLVELARPKIDMPIVSGGWVEYQ